MDILLRTIAIIIEMLLLATIVYAILNGTRLAALDLGIKPKYDKAIAVALYTIGFILVLFFITHLVMFYPKV